MKNFFESDLWWSILLGLIAFVPAILAWLKDKFGKKRKISKITHELLCAKQDLIIELIKADKDEKKIKELRDKIDALHNKLDIYQK